MQLSAHTRSKGFALLITVTLLAFLVLLLVSLASLTRVETQVASNNQQLSQARQNALMALNIALGQLQKYVGPDQRTTARSDMDAALANTTTASGRWLGAYGNGAAADYAMTPVAISANLVDPSVSDAKGSQAKLLNWLVSGNETAAFDPAAHVGANGNITTPPSSIPFSPTAVVTGLSPGSTALTDSITIANKPARLLVGPNTVGDSVSDYVAVPLRDITAEAPGMGTTPVPVGRYAWWVGDENAKARINLPIATAAQIPRAFVSSQRAAVELVDAAHANGSTTLTPSDMLDRDGSRNLYDPSSPLLPNLLSEKQWPLTASGASVGTLRTVSQYRYHDLSLRSLSVHSDTYAGGLKKDLSALLAKITPAIHASPFADTDFIFPPEPYTAIANELGAPTWGALRSFAQQTDTAGTATRGITPAPPTLIKPTGFPVNRPVSTTNGVGPVMTNFTLGFKYIAPGATNADGYPADGNPIRTAAYPVVVLWNPYTTDMLPAQYEVGISKSTYYGRVELSAHSGPSDTSYVWGLTNKVENRNLIYSNDSNTSDPYFRFIVESTKGIKAGESVVYTLQQNGQNYTAVSSTNKLSDADYYPYYYVLLNNKGNSIGTSPAPGATTVTSNGITTSYSAGQATYRVGVNKSDTKTHYDSKLAAVTYFDPGWSDFEQFGWSGNGLHYAYLGAVTSAGNKPTGTAPYTVSGSSVNSRQWYQSMSWGGVGNLGEAPFGWNVSFPASPKASVKLTQGPYSGRWPALLQDEAPLEALGTAPAWRLNVKIKFQETSSGWVSSNNPRGFQNTNSHLLPNISSHTGADLGNNISNSIKIPASLWPPFYVNIDPVDSVAKSRSGKDWWQSGITKSTLWELRPGDQPLLSIGQLQHANLGWIAANQAYAIGNSRKPSFLNEITTMATGKPKLPSTPEKVARLYSDYPFLSSSYANGDFRALYDQSWLVNRMLWDRHFVSTVPSKGTASDAVSSTLLTTDDAVPPELPNPRNLQYNYDSSQSPSSTLRNINKAAAHLMLSGGFNINSTSEQAWRAILGSTNRLSYDPTGTDPSGAHSGPVFSRFSKPTTNLSTETWLGYRKLNETQIAQFAQNIVKQIRQRGPFVSLSDFINRRLVDNAATTEDERSTGALQSAIDDTTASTGINPVTPVSYSPQYLTQADVLGTIGNNLFARSDTFTIRTYGEVLDPVNSTSTAPITTGRAWCEVTVQRLPDYINTAVTSSASGDPQDTAYAALQNTTNKNFGRKFKIISFRWLSPNDI